MTFFVLDIMQVTFAIVHIADLPTSSLRVGSTLRVWARKRKWVPAVGI